MSETSSGPGQRLRSFLLAAGSLAALAWLVRSGPLLAPKSHTAGETGASVSVEFDFGGGRRETFAKVPWSAGMTVLDAMRGALGEAGLRRLDYRGEGERAILDAIDGQRNEGYGAQRRNWLCWLNDQLIRRGFGVQPVAAGDQIVWRFSTLPPEMAFSGTGSDADATAVERP